MRWGRVLRQLELRLEWPVLMEDLLWLLMQLWCARAERRHPGRGSVQGSFDVLKAAWAQPSSPSALYA